MEVTTLKFKIASIEKGGQISISQSGKLTKRINGSQSVNQFNLSEYFRSVKPHIGLLCFIK